MNTNKQLARHLRELHVGKNWTWSNMKDALSDVTWKEAITQIEDFNTIAVLTFHINYYYTAQIKALQTGKLESSDKLSFKHPEISSEKDWQKLLKRVFKEAEVLASLLEKLPSEKLEENFIDQKYGDYFRNIAGAIEHGHYHLGQIVILKKLLRKK